MGYDVVLDGVVGVVIVVEYYYIIFGYVVDEIVNGFCWYVGWYVFDCEGWFYYDFGVVG